MSITTKTGDGKMTDLIGKRVPKTDKRIELIGTVDELLSVLSIANSHIEIQKYNEEITICQEALFRFNSQIAGAKFSDLSSFVNYFEESIAMHEDDDFSFSFVTKKAASFIDLARSVSRRAERVFYEANIEREDLKQFINRISDYLYVLSRLLESEGI